MNLFKNNNSPKNNEDKKEAEISKMPAAAEMKKLSAELEECKKKTEEYLGGWKRTQADFVNYKKRQEEALDEWIIFSKTNLMAELLPVLDSFDTALKSKPASLDEEGKKWVEGIAKIAEQMQKVLKDAGMEEIASVGEKLDPQVHEAVDIVPSDKEEGEIIEEAQKGYKVSGKVIRTAKVRVAVKKQQAQT